MHIFWRPETGSCARPLPSLSPPASGLRSTGRCNKTTTVLPTSPEPRRVVHGTAMLAEDLAAYRKLVGDDNEVYARLQLELEALLCGPTADAAVTRRLERTWRTREFVAYYERPLLLQAALRFDALSNPGAHPLMRALRSEDPDPRFVTRLAVRSALDPDRLVPWLALATRKVQTNEVSRSVAWLWPTSLIPARPIVLVDVGCSAGLNLVADGLELSWTGEDGETLELRPPRVLERIGFDRSPIDITRDDEATWLQACIWPGEHARLRRLEQAIRVFREHAPPPRIERVSAQHIVPRLRRIEAAADADATVVVYQTLVRDYIDATERAHFEAELGAWLEGLAPGRAIVLELELPNDDRSPPAELTARPSGSRPISLARCGYHPSRLEVNEAGARAFREQARAAARSKTS